MMIQVNITATHFPFKEVIFIGSMITSYTRRMHPLCLIGIITTKNIHSCILIIQWSYDISEILKKSSIFIAIQKFQMRIKLKILKQNNQLISAKIYKTKIEKEGLFYLINKYLD